MSYSNQGGAGGLGGGNFGVNIIQQLLSAIQQSLNSLVTVITDITQILASNNTWTGNNTFDNTATFNTTVDVNGPTVLTGTTQLIGNTTFSGGTASFTSGATFNPPPTVITGNALATFIEPEGLLNAQLVPSGSGNGADTTFDTLFQYVLLANSLSVTAKGVRIKCWGYFASNGNNKRLQFQINGVTQYTSAVLTNNAGWWRFDAELYKSAANFQLGTCILFVASVIPEPVDIIASATDTSPITFVMQGASPTAGAANDVVARAMVVEFIN